MKTYFRSMLMLWVVASIAAFNFSCNEGVEGFNAEFGSTVEVSKPGNATSDTSVAGLVTIFVKNSLGEPAQGVQVQIFCNNCELYDKAEGEPLVTTDFTRLQLLSQPIVTKTGSRGIKQLVVLAPAPADLGETSYEVEIIADIGVAQSTATFTVTEP